MLILINVMTMDTKNISKTNFNIRISIIVIIVFCFLVIISRYTLSKKNKKKGVLGVINKYKTLLLSVVGLVVAGLTLAKHVTINDIKTSIASISRERSEWMPSSTS